ncbi:MAG: M15 family metallopeptidase [Clostridiales bacterium]|nr:M15 family metallopeptidase [Clostridiales bacterium]
MKTRAVLLICALFIILNVSAGIAEPETTPAPAPSEAGSILELGGDLALVNRSNRISKTYVPNNLTQPKVSTRKDSLKERIHMQAHAAQALEKMFGAALMEEGYTLYATSGYRAYGIQQILFNSKIEEVGSREKAQRRVAPPGSSEHQLGLVMDMQAPSHLNLSQAFGETQEGKWAGENAHRFGFILRYKTAWREVTGVSDEPWHFRYVGIAHASAMHDLDIPLEIYVEHAKQLPEYVLRGANHVLLSGLIKELMEGNHPSVLDDLRNAKADEQAEALRKATLPMLKAEQTYEDVLYYAYPTPKPTAAPWTDEDEEEVELFFGSNP